MNEPVSREVGSNAGLGAVLTYRSAGRSGVHGMTLGAAGEGDFAVLFTGNQADAEFAAAEYLRRLVNGGWRITASMIVPNEPRFTGESIRTVAAPLPTVGG